MRPDTAVDPAGIDNSIWAINDKAVAAARMDFLYIWIRIAQKKLFYYYSGYVFYSSCVTYLTLKGLNLKSDIIFLMEGTPVRRARPHLFLEERI